jgi:hypothetical protein
MVVLLTAVIFGAGVFCLGIISDWLVLHAGRSPLIMVAGDVLMGLSTGLLVYVYERRRLAALERKLETIRETNHHIRNQLDLIEYSAYQSEDPELFSRLHQAVTRIDWTLREIVGKQ